MWNDLLITFLGVFLFVILTPKLFFECFPRIPLLKLSILHAFLFGTLFYIIQYIANSVKVEVYEGFDSSLNTVGITNMKQNVNTVCTTTLNGDKLIFDDATQSFDCHSNNFPSWFPGDFIKFGKHDATQNIYSSTLYKVASYQCKQLGGTPSSSNGNFYCKFTDSDKGNAYCTENGDSYDSSNNICTIIGIQNPQSPQTLLSTMTSTPTQKKFCTDNSGTWTFDIRSSTGVCLYENITNG